MARMSFQHANGLWKVHRIYQLLPWMNFLNEQTVGFSTLIIVILPLQSFMEDQCNCMKEIGMSSVALLYENSIGHISLNVFDLFGLYFTALLHLWRLYLQLAQILSQHNFRLLCINFPTFGGNGWIRNLKILHSPLTVGVDWNTGQCVTRELHNTHFSKQFQKFEELFFLRSCVDQ